MRKTTKDWHAAALSIESEIVCLHDSHADNLGDVSRSIVEPNPFGIIEPCATMDEQFVGFVALVLRGVSVDGKCHDFLRCFPREMVLSGLRRIPFADRSLEDDPIAGIQEHLRSAARIARVSVLSCLKTKPR